MMILGRPVSSRFLASHAPRCLGLPANPIIRWSSYSAPQGPHADPRKKVTISKLQSLYRKNEPITVLTAHDFPSGLVADAAGIDAVLVGDSLGMVALGMEDTNSVTIEEMLVHCRSVTRAVKSAFLIGDLPMGSYEVSTEQAVRTVIKMVKEGHVNAVKMECGAEMAPTIKRITEAGIPVIAHIGLTPQRQHSLGGFRVQGKTVAGAVKVLQDALAVQEAGAFMILVEAVPAEVAAIVTKRLRVPTIGIGSGNGCSGQALVQADMTGNFPPGRFVPKFVKTFADVWGGSIRGIEEYKRQVKTKAFPDADYGYEISEEELAKFKDCVDGAVKEQGKHSK
ncbi:putative 3-methyl-2-oxobutanoate hydroxymethyltransferase [Aspergillus sclerotiicarbonarius CBS 121057]|uniref:3-methyl-2-oxobutanoate hydroxymethyltransferase n=1 Tax=Aspergillus sclerotiicarbonarius (strain CBS 121057 / IBT 28362) TaxID=1448318 RepID=A0A319FES3_ASPSB|nr:putative 3-methyl-2-oxobutanoate hydroxymethyltransferase [Aspergillus sclerotiicarbonarius CBS 121057]